MAVAKLATEFETAGDSPGFLLWQVTNKWQAKQRVALKSFGLTHVQFVLLASLTWLKNSAPVTQEALARHAQTDRMMTSQVLRVLERKGLIRREKSLSDKRAFALSATSQGISLVNKAIIKVEAVDKIFFARLEGDKKRFVKKLSLLAR